MSQRAAGLVVLTVIAVAVILVVALATGGMTSPSADPRLVPTTLAPATPTVDPAVQSRAEARAAKAARADRLFRLNGCWSGEAPAGVVPTRALVTLPGKQPALVAVDVGYGIWLDGDAGQLHGFCP